MVRILYKQAQKTLNLERSDLKIFQIQGCRGNNRFVSCSRFFFCYSVIKEKFAKMMSILKGRITSYTGDDLWRI